MKKILFVGLLIIGFTGVCFAVSNADPFEYKAILTVNRPEVKAFFNYDHETQRLEHGSLWLKCVYSISNAERNYYDPPISVQFLQGYNGTDDGIEYLSKGYITKVVYFDSFSGKRYASYGGYIDFKIVNPSHELKVNSVAIHCCHYGTSNCQYK